MRNVNNNVSRILIFSAMGALIFSIAGIFIGIASNSDMVLLDGLYSIISLMVASLSLFASIFIKKPDYKLFPFGKYVFQPLTIVINSIIMLLLCILSLVSSIFSILNGGREINANIGLAYGVFSLIGCGLIFLILFKNRKKSELIKAESLQWLLDTVLSFGLILGFIIMLVLQKTSFNWLVPYIDPSLVLLAGLILITMPIRLLYKNGKEIISMSASEEVQYKIYTIVKEQNLKYKITEEEIGVSKMGQVIYIDVQNIIESKSCVKDIVQADKYREEIIEVFNESLPEYDKWLNISFTEYPYSRQISSNQKTN